MYSSRHSYIANHDLAIAFIIIILLSYSKKDEWISEEQDTFVDEEPVTIKKLNNNARVVGPLELVSCMVHACIY